MSRFYTGNPLGSGSPLDLDDNAKNFDEAINTEDPNWVDRFGRFRMPVMEQERQFVAGQAQRENEFDAAQDDREQRFNTFIASSGYQFLGDYGPGIEFTEYNQLVRDANGEFWRLSGQVELPYTTTGDGIPEDDALVPAGDAVLRQDLSDPDKGAAIVARGVVAVDSIADLLALPQGQRKEDLRYEVTSYYGGWAVEVPYFGPRGGGGFCWDSTSTEAENGGTVFGVPGVDTGRWKRIASSVTLHDFGCRGDGVTPDTQAMQSAMSADLELRVTGTSVYYLIDGTVSVPNNKTVVFENKGTARIHFTGLGIALSLGSRITMRSPFVTGTALNNPVADNGQVALYFNRSIHTDIYSPRIFNIGRGVSFFTQATGNECHYNSIYSPEIRYCYYGVTTDQSNSYAGEQSFYGGRISACYKGLYLDEKSGDIQFFGTAFEGGGNSDYLVDVAGGAGNVLLGCRLEAANVGDKGLRIRKAATYTTVLGCYAYAQIEDESETSLIDKVQGHFRLLRQEDAASGSARNYADNGDLRGFLKAFSATDASYAYKEAGGLYGDAYTVNATATNGFIRSNEIVGPAAVDRIFTVAITYKRNAGGTQRVRLRVGSSSTPVLINARDDQSESFNTLTVNATIPAGDATVDVYIYPDEANGTGGIDLSRIVVCEGRQATHDKARLTANSAPSVGAWRQGEIVYHRSPTASGFIGWVCVIGGTPGTWKEWGSINA